MFHFKQFPLRDILVYISFALQNFNNIMPNILKDNRFVLQLGEDHIT